MPNGNLLIVNHHVLAELELQLSEFGEVSIRKCKVREHFSPFADSLL